jgi:hypothetical protein
MLDQAIPIYYPHPSLPILNVKQGKYARRLQEDEIMEELNTSQIIIQVRASILFL